MSERLQSPEQCDNIKTLGAAACAMCVSSCPLARLARDRPTVIPAGNERIATAALMDDKVLSVGVDFDGGGAMRSEVYGSSPKITSSLEAKTIAARKERERIKRQEEVETQSRRKMAREAAARLQAERAVDDDRMRQQQLREAAQRRGGVAHKVAISESKEKLSLLDQMLRDLADALGFSSAR